eukprot:m.257859 g.257859  ORF g.257859 m.257859 type:complete len:217 (-) comp19185_c0_seq4:220-870(-)
MVSSCLWSCKCQENPSRLQLVHSSLLGMSWLSRGVCCSDGVKGDSDDATAFNFAESELVIEPEEEQEEDGRTEQERIAEFEAVVKQTKAKVTGQDSGLDDIEAESKADPIVLAFRERTKAQPEQVLRYQLGGEPLWIGSRQPSASDIPLCPNCAADRAFEFQICPQLIPYLEVEETLSDTSMDLGVLAVYTCSNSCTMEAGQGYSEEVVWHNKVND